ncbi:MAG: hypothetical protein AB1689_01170, partial [Thermodesulfobacteriota bacterium]
ELGEVTTALARATGLGGRPRRASRHLERVRVSVARTVALALKRMGQAHPTLAHHLRTCVRTGYTCAYLPSPADRRPWIL